jgi:hypothetical protein
MRGFNEKLFGDKLVAGQLPTQLGLIGSFSLITPILDLYPNAAAAYSLRKLRSAYTGSAIRVRRTNNDELDIGFTSSGALDTTSLLAFTGTGALDNGYVTTWYDQSGKVYNATQTTALSQPQIVSSGSVITENSKLAIQFANTFLSTPLASTLSQPNSIIITHKFNVSLDNQKELIDSFGQPQRTLLDVNGGNYRMLAGSSVDTTIASTLNQTLAFAIFNSSSSSLSINGFLKSSLNPGTAGLDSFFIGYTGAANILNGLLQEIIIYNSDQSSNRTGIETNINDFYSIY